METYEIQMYTAWTTLYNGVRGGNVSLIISIGKYNTGTVQVED